MSILHEVQRLVEEGLGDELQKIAVERLVLGLFFTGVKLSTGAGGVCFTPVRDIPDAVCCPRSAGRIFHPTKVRGMNVQEVLAALSSHEPLKTAVGIATLNALSAACWKRGLKGQYEIKMGLDGLDAVRMPQEKSVAVVGALVPALRYLKSRGGTWWVIEQDPKTLKEDELCRYVPATNPHEVLSKADVLIITGATLVNRSLDQILSMARPGSEIAVVGPTVSFLPEPLFQRGVRIVGGVYVKKPDQLLDILTAGGPGYHFFGDLATRMVIENPQKLP